MPACAKHASRSDADDRKITAKETAMQTMRDAGVILLLDLAADLTILVFCTACLIDMGCEKLETALLTLVEH
jgi:hypothetical protein